MTHEKYNGWSNYETWLLNLNLTTEQGIYESTVDYVQVDLTFKYEFDFERIKAFKEYLESLYYIEKYSVYCIFDTWTGRDWNKINFKEIYDTFKDLLTEV